MKAHRERMRRLMGELGAIRTLQAVTFLFVVLLAIGLIGASPLALEAFRGAPARWERLSFIGQTYGAASAVLSVLAIIGVAATLVFQARESKAAREQAIRESNTELLRMAMDDPSLHACWGPTGPSGSFEHQRQQMYVNMIISQWEMAYETRSLGEAHLRLVAHRLFSGPIGRDFWASAREGRIGTAASRRARSFHRILEEEYQRAGRGQAVRLSSPSTAHTDGPGNRSSARRAASLGIGVGVVIGGAAASWLSRAKAARQRRGRSGMR